MKQRIIFPALVFALVLAACNGAAVPPPATQTNEFDGLTLALGAPTDGGIQPLLGVNIGPIPAGASTNADLTEAYHSAGVTMIRTHDYYGPLDMSRLYPDQNADPLDPASYDFAESDRVFTAILAGGFEPYLRLGDSFSGGRGAPPISPRAPMNLDHWVKAAVEVTRHYRGMANEAGVPMRYVEIWNEPDNGKFWDATPEQFFILFDETACALKQEFPDLQVGGPGFAPSGALAQKGIAFTRGLLDYARTHHTPFDFFSWHMYSNDPQDYVKAAQFYRSELDVRGFASVRMHVTEWNTESRGREAGITPEEARLGGRGAAILTAAWIAMQQYGVSEATFYRGPDPAMDASTFYGMYYADGRPKRAALAFSLWAELARHPQAVNITLSGPSDLWILAGQNAAGEVTLLFANPTGEAVTLTLLQPDGTPTEAATGHTVSDASEVVETSTVGAQVHIPAYAVLLVTIP